ncbi:hypothetical protein HDV00_011379 [Rhizophlyctis rosea]|nr:hypothetical protein HDV00_011379 [Rhizophlyctis rosea]
MQPLPPELYSPIETSFPIGVILSVLYDFHSLRDYTIPLLPFASLDHASRKGQTELLDWWAAKREKGILDPHWSCEALDFASREGHVEVLKWWKNSFLRPLEYEHRAFVMALENGHMPVLEWRKFSGLKIYDNIAFTAMDAAGENGHIDVMEWVD